MTSSVVVLDALAFAGLAAMMLWLAVKDIRERRVPNKALGALIVAWLIWRIVRCVASGQPIADAALSMGGALASALAVMLLLWLFASVYERARRKPSMGAGDVKLISVLVLCMGARCTMLCLLVACIVGLLYSLPRAARRLGVDRGIPFAACLACGTLAVPLLA